MLLIFSKRKIDYFVWFILGYLVFSRFSAFVLLELLRFPIYFPELLMLPFFPYLYIRYKKDIRLIYSKGKLTLILLIVGWLCLIVISLIFNEYGIKYILATARGYFYVIIGFIIGKYNKRFNLDIFYYISLGSILSAFIWLLFNRVQPGDVYYLNLTCLFLLVLIPFIQDRIPKLIYLVPVAVYAAIMSGLRRAIFIIIIALFIGIINFLIKKSSHWTKIGISIFVLLIFLFSGQIVDYLINYISNYPYLFERIVVKTTDTLTGEVSRGDNIRLQLIQSIGEYAISFSFPRGFLTKAPDLTGTGLFMDLPLYELFYTFSSVVIMLFLINIVIKSYTFIKKRYLLIIPIYILVMFLFLVMDGGFLFWFYQAIFTGIFLGYLFNKNLQFQMNNDG